MKNIPVIVFLLFLTSCIKKDKQEGIIIEGQVSNIPNGKLYLVEAHKWQIPLDSTNCINGHFVFRIKQDSLFAPYMAAIQFRDSTKSTKVSSLFFRNYMIGADSMKDFASFFYLEKGSTWIEGDNATKPFLRVFAGKETDLMFKSRYQFGAPGTVDSVKRLRRIVYIEKKITKSSYSYFLLRSIYNAKEQYTEEELTHILSLFDEGVQNSTPGKQLKTYLANRTDQAVPYPNLLLLNSNNKREAVIDTSSKLSMLVFWASWCGPCRMEIPVLKKIHDKYKRTGLNIASVSIDEDEGDWKKALKEEKMTWAQYHVDKDKIDVVSQQFNLSAIPLVIFTDHMGIEVLKFTGYDEDQQKRYERVIDQFFRTLK